MPTIYLSPSTQQANLYVNGGTEEYWMNQLADRLVPYLRSNGIQYVRNDPDMTAGSSVRQSNAGKYDLHLALHSNAAPEGRYGELRGTDVYYDPRSSNGKRAADIIAENFKTIYPNPNRVRPVSTTTLGEVTDTKAPAVLVETAYHDNSEDATWIKNNLDEIARILALSLTEYFDIPFVKPQKSQEGTVSVSSGRLNIRSRPTVTSSVLTQANNGDSITVLGTLPNWYVVNYKGTVGYAYRDFIDIP